MGIRDTLSEAVDIQVTGESGSYSEVRETLRNVACDVLILDEPTAALDGPLGRQVMELFAKIAHEKNAGVIVVTHDHRTLDVFDRILDVEDGMIRVRSATPQTPS